MNIKRDIFLRVRPLLFIPFIVLNSLLSLALGPPASNLIVRSSACVELASLHRVDLAEIDAEEMTNVPCKTITERMRERMKPAVGVLPVWILKDDKYYNGNGDIG